MTPPTQQDKPIDLEALRPSLLALKKYAAEATLWGKPEIRVESEAVTALFSLIDAQQKKIAALEGAAGQAGFAADCGFNLNGTAV